MACYIGFEFKRPVITYRHPTTTKELMSKKQGIKTRAIHTGYEPESAFGSLAPPIYSTATFAYKSAEDAAARFAQEEDGYIYTRWGNPTNAIFETKLADLEGGEAALSTASGMAAISTAILTCVRQGDHVIAGQTLYSATQTFLAKRAQTLGIEVTFVDQAEPKKFANAIRPNTRLIYLESPGNPTLKLTDLAAVAAIADEKGIMTIADNTFSTPINQRPLELGVNAVVYSATKYLGGHGDLVGGAIVGSQEFIERVWPVLIELGGTLSPFNGFLLARGMQTLPLRMKAHNETALCIAQFLEEHPEVREVVYPGLETHSQHELACKQMTGFGGMICIEVSDIEKGRRIMNSVKLCTLTVSLGDVKTLICHPASMTHSKVPKDLREQAGVTDGLIRISVGIEDVEDLKEDLDQALRA